MTVNLQDAIKKIFDASVDFRCPICTASEFISDNDLVNYKINDKEVLPTIVLCCKFCGYIMNFYVKNYGRKKYA